jgi:predicted outer membrane repeat protein
MGLRSFSMGLLSLVLALHASAAVWYVDLDSVGTEDGTSWTTAYHDVQDGIDAAFNAGGGEVWVAEGLYYQERDNPSGSILMKSGVHLYGGFAGNETQRAQRDWQSRAVNLAGAEARAGEQAYHVLIGANDATLDGFIIIGGDASGPEDFDQHGGGLLNVGVSPLIAHCSFAGNSAGWGGAISNRSGASPRIHDCTFAGNTATVNGGAIHCWDQCHTEILRCWFIANQAERMGGAFLEGSDSASTVAQCYFYTNLAERIGGGIANYTGGGTVVVNCVFHQNSVIETLWGGGGFGSFESAPIIINCSFSNNTSLFGSAVYQSGPNPVVITNSILWGNGSSEVAGSFVVTYSDIQGGYPGTGNIDADPKFTAGVGGLFYLYPDSPCIDTATAQDAPSIDILDAPRPIDIPGVGFDGAGQGFDMGAYESGGGGEGEGEGEGLPEGEGEGATCIDICAGQPASPDVDGDGLSACVELCAGTNPEAVDTDGDGMPDGFEVRYGLDPLADDAQQDADLDGLTNLEEFLRGSNPLDPNSPGSTYYVSYGGNDVLGNGSRSQPWATLTHALSQVSGSAESPKRILAATGEYTESLVMKPWVTIASIINGTVVVVGSVIGADHSGLENVILVGPGRPAEVPAEVTPLLDLDNVAMDLIGVTFINDAVGLRASGPASAQCVIEACTFRTLRVGIEIWDDLPTLRRCLFEDITQTGILVRERAVKGILVKSLGDETDPASGWNTFDIDPGSGAKAIVNERDETILMQNNDWGTNSPAEIAALVDGPAVVEPFLAAGSGVLAAAIICTVWDADTQAPVLNATVQITPSVYAPVSQNKNGVYSFPAIAEGQYSVTTSATGYVAATGPASVGSGALVSLTIPLAKVQPEGEPEGEGEGEPEPDGCNCGKSAPLLPSPGQAFLAVLSLVVLLGFGRSRP